MSAPNDYLVAKLTIGAMGALALAGGLTCQRSGAANSRRIPRLEPLPDFVAEGTPAFHGGSARLETDGLCPGPASEVSGRMEGYGWDHWSAQIVRTLFSEFSPSDQRRFAIAIGIAPDEVTRWLKRLQKAVTEWREWDSWDLSEDDYERYEEWGPSAFMPYPLEDLGDLISLFFVTLTPPHGTRGGGPARIGQAQYQVDVSQLRYLFWMHDELAGESSYVFVLPRCPPLFPLAPPSAFKRVGP